MIPQVRPYIDIHEMAAVTQAVQSGWITEGPRCEEFSERLLKLIGAPYGVFAPNGTLALALGLMALQMQPTDEVIVPDLTFIGSANAVLLAGARPVFVDVDPLDYQMDPMKLGGAITPNTRAIMPVHLFGTAAPMDAICEIASRHKLVIIEDACQGIGVQYDGHHVGSIGDIGCFSFFGDKTITTGEGGFVVTQHRDIYDRMKLLRNQGRPNSGTFVHPSVGYNFRITDMQGAMGCAQMDKLDEIIRRKNALRTVYLKELQDLPVHLLGAAPDSNLVPFRMALVTSDAEALAERLHKNGVESRRFFHPLHSQPCFKGLLPPRNVEFPVSNEASLTGLCLPIFPAMTPKEVLHVCAVIRAFFSA